MARPVLTDPERFACNECGQVYTTFDKAAHCHWGIGCPVSSVENPREFARCKQFASELAEFLAYHTTSSP
jgi:hypothetical protein